jgi:hypothetical protein
VYYAPHIYSHHQSGFPVELFAQLDPRTKKNDKLFCTFEEVEEVDEVDELDELDELDEVNERQQLRTIKCLRAPL